MDFGSVKNVGTAVVDTIVKERKENGKFKSFTDFCERMNREAVNKKCIESLIKAGAFDEFEQTRSTLLASFEGIIDTINNTVKKQMQGQVTMFDLDSTQENNVEDIKYKFINLEEFDQRELLSMEKEMLGIYISGHPLEKLKDKIQKISTINTMQMLKIKEENDLIKDGEQVKYVGIINSVKKKYTKKNTLMAFVTVEDLYGATEVIVFDSCYSKSQNVLIEENIVLIDGRLSIREDDDAKIVANNIIEFNSNAQLNNTNSVGVGITDDSRINVKYNQNTVGVDAHIDPIKPKHIIINITNLSEDQKAKLRGAIKFFSGDRNNIVISVQQGEKILPCGGIFMTNGILEQFEKIAGKENVILK